MTSSGLDASARCLEADIELTKARESRLGVVLARGQVARSLKTYRGEPMGI